MKMPASNGAADVVLLNAARVVRHSTRAGDRKAAPPSHAGHPPLTRVDACRATCTWSRAASSAARRPTRSRTRRVPLTGTGSGDPSTTPGLVSTGWTHTDARARFQAGKRALIIACEHGQLAVAGLLLDRGANASATAWDGFTALHVAVARWDAPLVRLLVAHGASTAALDRRGMTPEQARVTFRSACAAQPPLSRCAVRATQDFSTFLNPPIAGWPRVPALHQAVGGGRLGGAAHAAWQPWAHPRRRVVSRCCDVSSMANYSASPWGTTVAAVTAAVGEGASPVQRR